MAADNNSVYDLSNFTERVAKIIERYWQPFLGVLVVGLVVWGALIAKNMMTAADEKKAFDELFAVTSVYMERADQFAEAKMDEEQAELEKKQAQDKDSPIVDKKPDQPQQKASGDLQKDFGDIVEKLEAYIKKYPSKKATGEAALTLAAIYDEYNSTEKAATLLANILQQWQHRDLLYLVLQMRAGDLWSKVGECEKSLPYWQVLSEKENFLQAEATLKIGACYQKVGKLDMARSWYQKLTAKDPSSPQAQSAEKYLRYMDFQKKLSNKESSQTPPTANQKES